VERGLFRYVPNDGVYYDGQRVEVSRTVHELVGALMRANGATITKPALHDRIGYEGDRPIVDVYVCTFRRVLRLRGVADPIRTVRGVGFAWVVQA
jgi:DNA-binding response OmpR family regulator